MDYKIENFNFSNYSNKEYIKFTSNFIDDRDFSNFMRGTGQRVLQYLSSKYLPQSKSQKISSLLLLIVSGEVCFCSSTKASGLLSLNMSSPSGLLSQILLSNWLLFSPEDLGVWIHSSKRIS